MIPALDKDSFLQKFHTLLARGTRSVTRSWLALLNVVFAISSNIMASTSPTQELAEVSEKYYHRALTLVMPSIIEKSNFQNLQLLALMGSYLQGTRHSTQAWTFHGLAVKSALELGLHTPEASKNLPPLEREMRKRCWYWILINDRILSANFGRPCMISATTKALELPNSISSSSQKSNGPSLLADAGVSMLNAVITLTEVMSNAVATLYGSNSGCSTAVATQDIICGIVRLTCELEDWKKALPDNLYIMTAQTVFFNEKEPLELQRARVLLTIRYLGVRILVLRPILREFLEYSTSDGGNPNKVVLLRSLGVPFLRDCVDSCVEVASMVEAILRVFRSGNEIMGAWWFSAYYTFNASLVIMGVLIVCKSSSYESCFSPETIKDMYATVNRAICVLQELDNGNVMIRKCREHLIILLQRYSSRAPESALYFAGGQRESYDFGASMQNREPFSFPGALSGIDLMAQGNPSGSTFDFDLGAGMLDGSTVGSWI
ncbi:fungal-specific transcription factor domain-containing protein [Halenospora varia]|nr:fungal-specific transcription factor domain-containing protein [Halenospora varia]